jgi:hypothetical protein
MPFTPAEKISQGEFTKVLETLKLYLDNLPNQLPLVNSSISRYASFLSFNLDPDLLDHTGCEVATLGEQLEGIFGLEACTSGDGVLPILERGAAICAVHPLLQLYHKKFPENNVLKKWVIDIAEGAEKAFAIHGVAVSAVHKQ